MCAVQQNMPCSGLFNRSGCKYEEKRAEFLIFHLILKLFILFKPNCLQCIGNTMELALLLQYFHRSLYIKLKLILFNRFSCNYDMIHLLLYQLFIKEIFIFQTYFIPLWLIYFHLILCHVICFTLLINFIFHIWFINYRLLFTYLTYATSGDNVF